MVEWKGGMEGRLYILEVILYIIEEATEGIYCFLHDHKTTSPQNRIPVPPYFILLGKIGIYYIAF